MPDATGKFIKLPEKIYWPDKIYELKTTDPVYGGEWTRDEESEDTTGISNRQAYEFALRTEFLKDRLGDSVSKITEIYYNLLRNLEYTADYTGALFQELYANRIKNIKVISTLKAGTDPSVNGQNGMATVIDPIQDYIPGADTLPELIKKPIMPNELPDPEHPDIYPDDWPEYNVADKLTMRDYFIDEIVKFQDDVQS
jgi:hypothetical protein